MPVPHRFLLPLTAALLGGCNSATQERAATPPPDSTPQAAAPLPAPDSGGRAAVDSAPAAPRPERLVLLPVSADIGPHPLECDVISQAGLPREKDGRLSGTFYWGGRLLLTRPDSSYLDDALLLRYHPRDTTWLQLPLSVSDDYQFSEPRHPQVQLVNLDRQGPPEVLVYFYDEAYGAGGGTSDWMLNVFALDADAPRLLLRAMLSAEDEMHPDNDKGEIQTLSTTTERTVRLRGHDIELGAPESYASGGAAVERKKLPGPSPGRYRYQRGRLYRVEATR